VPNYIASGVLRVVSGRYLPPADAEANDASRGPKMKKKIAKVMPAGFGHLMLEFEDGVKQMVQPIDAK